MQDAHIQLEGFIEGKIDSLKELNKQRIENWKNSLIEYTNLKGAGVEGALSLLIIDAEINARAGIDNKISVIKPVIEQDIRNYGDRIVAERSGNLSTILTEVRNTIAAEIATEQATVTVTVTQKIAGKKKIIS